MIPTKEQQASFEEVARPVVEWLNNNCHPHVTVVITTTGAELSEGVCAFYTMEYVKD
jgi:hypothetical protein